MAKYTVTAGCGHTVEQQLYGPGRERTRRLEWMESTSGKCSACYAAGKREAERARVETETQAFVLQLLNQLDRLPADEYPAALERLRVGVAERMRLAPAAAGKEPRVVAAMRVLSERAEKLLDA